MSSPAFDFAEPVVIERLGDFVAEVGGGYDPHETALYLPAGTDIELGDVVTFRDQLYRVTDPPERWLNPWTGWQAGVVARLSLFVTVTSLPDEGTLSRANGTTWDLAANTEVPAWLDIWTGPCLVSPPSSEGSEAEAGEQRLSIQPFSVSVPLALVDIRPDDRFTVTASNDPRLVGRPLQVTRVKGASLAQLRIFTAIDNQG